MKSTLLTNDELVLLDRAPSSTHEVSIFLSEQHHQQREDQDSRRHKKEREKKRENEEEREGFAESGNA